MSDFGVKVVKEGKDISTTDPRDVYMSSQYPMLKIHSDSLVSVTFNPGDTEKTVDITHGLGYTPAFIAYYNFGGRLFYVPSIPRASDYNSYGYAYSDSTKVRCGFVFSSPYNQIIKNANDWWSDRYSGSANYIFLGKADGFATNGYLRFTDLSLTQNQSIVSATLDLAVEYKGSGSGNLEQKIYGIDEDNTSAFESTPSGRSQTSAVTDISASLPSAGQYSGVNVKSQVEEIIARGGWSTGNAMGFYMVDDGTNDDIWLEDDKHTGITSKLTITKSGTTTVDFRVVVFKDKIA